jgi:hypothetical protein
VFAARTSLPAEWGVDADAVDRSLDSCRRRWNQFGVEARVRPATDAGATVVRYRLTVTAHADPAAVHAAFRGDLDEALGRLAPGAPGPPEAWSLEELARAAATAAIGPAAAALVYQDDAGGDW